MRFDSKSLLSTIQISHLEFTCRNIAEWCAANSPIAGGRSRIHGIPDTLPVDHLGSGNYGACYRLRDYPGLVLKLCNDQSDGYPEYIRQVAKVSRRKAWMPVVFMHGGHEKDGLFWCVLPEYENPWGHDSFYMSPFPEDGKWLRKGLGHDLICCYSKKDRARHLREEKLTRKQRRQMAQMQEFLRPMAEAGGEIYCHAMNLLKDGEQWVLTDPIAGWHLDDKFNANL